MKLEQVVPWGRNAHEYLRMFDLLESELTGRILGCGDGPASFNAELTALGRHVISVDPIYVFSAEAIRSRVDATYETIIGQVKQHPERYVWREFADADAVGATRLAAMECFLADFETGKREGRYIEGSLPDLPFEPDSFDLTLCSHLLFLYSEQLDADFHISAVRELLRLARDVRIFLLLALNCELSPHLPVVMAWCEAQGYRAEVRRVPYEFQVGGNQMFHIQRSGQ
jgi:SAM-dependent methyltransferase